MLPNDGANHPVMYLLSLGEGTVHSEILFSSCNNGSEKNI